MPHFYTDPSRESELHALPDAWATFCEAGEMADHFGSDWLSSEPDPEEDREELTPAGFYVCACFPGGLPDSEWSGPFSTFAEAVAYWREMFAA